MRKVTVLGAMITCLLALEISKAENSVNLNSVTAVDAQRALHDMSKTISTMADLYYQVKSRDVVVLIDEELNKVVNETVVETHSSKDFSEETGFACIACYESWSWSLSPWSWAASASSFAFGVPYVGRYSSTHRWDVTKMITANPEEVAQFPRRSRALVKKAHKDLLAHVNSHRDNIIALKLSALVALSQLSTAMDGGLPVNEEIIRSIEFMALEINFVGQVNITTCTTTNFAKTVNSVKGRSSVGLGSIFMLPGASDHEKKVKKAHRTKNCQSSTNQLVAQPTDSLYLVDLTRLDHEVAEALSTVYAKYLFSQVNAEPILDWGSPYFRELPRIEGVQNDL